MRATTGGETRRVPTNFEPHVKAGVEGRSRVVELAERDPSAALLLARSIDHPWYRCQALSKVAERTADAREATSILGLALNAARELDEPNRIVTVASWPLKVLVSRHLADVAAEVDRLLKTIASEPHTLRRAHALFSLLEAVFSDVALRHEVLAALLAALAASRGWRADRLWAFTTFLVAAESADAASRVFQQMPESREKRRVGQRIASPESVGPRWIHFFQG